MANRAASWAAAAVELTEAVRPGAFAHERLLPVLPVFTDLLPLGGLRRGSVVRAGGGAAMSLALALAAGASAAGSWVGIVGLPSVGLAAAAELGVALERMFLVAEPPARSWAEITAAVAEGAEIVLSRVPAGVRPAEVRRVQARLQHRGAVLVLVDGSDPAGSATAGPGADLELTAIPLAWEGIGEGHGRLLARRVRVDVSGRRAGRPVGTELWLPGPDGRVGPAAPAAVPFRPREAG